MRDRHEASWCGGTVRRERVERHPSWVDVWRRTGRHRRNPIREAVTGGRDGSRARPRGLLAKVGETPDATLAELQALLKERDLSVGTGTVWRFFDRHGISFKKNRALAAEQERPDVAARRLAWLERCHDPISVSPPTRCSSMRPAPRPRWPVCGAARSVANACRGPRSHMTIIGRQLPSPPV